MSLIVYFRKNFLLNLNDAVDQNDDVAVFPYVIMMEICQ